MKKGNTVVWAQRTRQRQSQMTLRAGHAGLTISTSPVFTELCSAIPKRQPRQAELLCKATGLPNRWADTQLSSEKHVAPLGRCILVGAPHTTFAVLYPVYLTLTPATLRPLPSFDIPQLQHPERHILHPCKCSAPAYCYLLWVNERPSVQDLHALLPALSYRHSYTNLCYGQLSILCAIESNDKSCLCTTQTLASCATANTTSKPLQ